MMNSISTIFTMDIVKHYGGRSEQQLVSIGRIVGLTALIIAGLVARPLLGNFDQAFQYIQEFTGFFTPGIVAIFLLAIFWKNSTANGALAAAIGSAVFSVAAKLYWPSLPFMDRVGLAFVLCVFLGMLVSRIQGAQAHPHAIRYNEVDTSTSAGFNWASLTIAIILTGLYATWW
jgi:SSS family solute:Na+ symporter